MMQGMEDPTLVDFTRKRSLEDDDSKALSLEPEDPHDPKKAKQTVDSILNQAADLGTNFQHYLPTTTSQLSHLSQLNQLNQLNQQLSQLNQLNLQGLGVGTLTDTKDGLSLGVEGEKPQYICQYCGIDAKTANLRRKHYKEIHPVEFQLKKKIPTPASKPVQPIDNALRTVFGMTQIKKMPGDVRDKRLRIQTLEKRILPKLVEWWGGNPKLFTQDLLQTEFLREALHEYLRKERY